MILLNARRLENVNLILVGLRDITERKRGEEDLRSAERDVRISNESLVRVNTDLKHFSYTVSHDMQEPLRMVTSFTQLLARDYQDKLGSQGQQYLDYALQGAERMESLLNDIREYWSVGEAKAEKLNLIDCNEALEKALANLKTAVENSGAVIMHDPLPAVFAEEYPITLLFQNIIANAVKYRGVEAPPRIHVSGQRNGTECTISVEDKESAFQPNTRKRFSLL